MTRSETLLESVKRGYVAAKATRNLLTEYGPAFFDEASEAVGGVRPLARLTGYSPSYISKVRRRQTVASPESVLAVSRVTGVGRSR